MMSVGNPRSMNEHAAHHREHEARALHDVSHPATLRRGRPECPNAPRVTPRRRLTVLLVVLPLLLACCPTTRTHSQNHPQKPANYPGHLVDTTTIDGDFLWDQEIVTSYRGLSYTLHAVVQKTGPKLDVLGLTPFGTRAFLLEQEGTEFRFESFVDQKLPFEARSILIDVHRVFFLNLPPPASGAGRVQGRLYDEQVTETWRAGRLYERRFTRPSGPEGEIVVTYEGGMSPGHPTQLIRLDNAWFGYELQITTLSAQNL